MILLLNCSQQLMDQLEREGETGAEVIMENSDLINKKYYKSCWEISSNTSIAFATVCEKNLASFL